MIYLTPDELETLTGYKRPVESIVAAKRPWNDPEHNYGVYFLFLGERLQYVGLAKDICTRISQHRYPDPPSLRQADWFDSISTIEIEDGDITAAVECYYIHALKPPRNIKYPKVGRLARALLA